jgi:hypothetical protein
VPGAGEPPAGVVIENRILRWRPRPDQEGRYLISIVISDGHLQACQLMQIRVPAAVSAGGRDGPDGLSMDARTGMNPRPSQRFRAVAACGLLQQGAPSSLGAGEECGHSFLRRPINQVGRGQVPWLRA